MLNLETIISLLPQARSITHLASLLGTARSTLRDFLTRNALPTDNVEALKTATGTSNKVSKAASSRIEDLVKIADLKRSVSQANQQYEFTVEVRNEPVIFCSWSDQHIGAAGVNHQALLNEVNELKRIRTMDQNFILILNGDLIDGYIKGTGHENNEQVLDLDEQRQFGKYVIETLKPELTISADHEAWSVTSPMEVNFTRDVCTANGLNYAQWQAKMIIRMDNGITKTALINHRYPGKTKINPTRHLQALHSERGPADIVTTGHYHSAPGAYKLNPIRQNEEQFWGLQSGTYKIGDGYGMKLNDYQGEYGIPALVIMPDGSIHGFDHYSDAVRFKEQVYSPLTANLDKIIKPKTKHCFAYCGVDKCDCQPVKLPLNFH